MLEADAIRAELYDCGDYCGAEELLMFYIGLLYRHDPQAGRECFDRALAVGALTHA